MTAGKVSVAELRRLNSLISSSNKLRRLVPRSTQSAWLTLKRRPTRSRVGRLLRAAGLTHRHLSLAPSKEHLTSVPIRLRTAWELTVRLRKRFQQVLLTGEGATDVWVVHAGPYTVTVSDLLTVQFKDQTVAHTEQLGAVGSLIEKHESRNRRRKKPPISGIFDLHKRAIKLHMPQ